MPTTAELFSLAYQHHVAGDFGRAEQLYRHVLQLEPGDANAWCFLGATYKAQGKLADAVHHYRRAIELKPDYAAAYYNLGLALEAQGSLVEAIHSYRQALQFEPGLLLARNNIGTVLAELGRHQESIECFQEVLRLQPDFAEAHLNLAIAQTALGNLDQAIASYQRALRLQPDFAEAHLGLGVLLSQQNKLDEAIACYRQALRCKPGFQDAMFNLGNSLQAQGKLDEAQVCYAQLLRLNPDHAGAHHNLGSLLLSREKLNEAAEHFRQAVRIRPDYAESQRCLGTTYLRLENLSGALAAFRHAALLQPDHATDYVHLGAILSALNQRQPAVDAYRQALRLKPDLVEVHANLGWLLTELDQWQEATAAFQEAIRLEPGRTQTYLDYAATLFRRERLDLALQMQEQALRLEPERVAAQLNPSCLHFVADHDPDVVFAEHCRWGRLHAGHAPLGQTNHANEPSPERRLRIGYVSPDFRLHALTCYFEPVLANHDPREVEVFCYSENAFPDDVTRRLQGLAHHWRVTYRRSDAEVAKQMRDDGIDILIDLAGHTVGNRLPVFAHKPAPIQATWLGYMNTTGLTAVDYRLTDEVLDPPGMPIRDTEQLLRLPGGFCCFAPPADAPAVSPLPALFNKSFVFGSLNSLMKINHRVFNQWSDVLHAVPRSRLLVFRHTLTAEVREQCRQEFSQRGIAAERLDLRQPRNTANYLAIYHEIDVSLDTYPCTGGMTTCESLWMGVPVISLCGERPASRNSAAILALIGLADWATPTSSEYVARAVQAANELERLAELRSYLRDRMLTTICDGRGFTRDLEKAYREMWRRWCSKVS